MSRFDKAADAAFEFMTNNDLHVAMILWCGQKRSDMPEYQSLWFELLAKAMAPHFEPEAKAAEALPLEEFAARVHAAHPLNNTPWGELSEERKVAWREVARRLGNVSLKPEPTHAPEQSVEAAAKAMADANETLTLLWENTEKKEDLRRMARAAAPHLTQWKPEPIEPKTLDELAQKARAALDINLSPWLSMSQRYREDWRNVVRAIHGIPIAEEKADGDSMSALEAMVSSLREDLKVSNAEVERLTKERAESPESEHAKKNPSITTPRYIFGLIQMFLDDEEVSALHGALGSLLVLRKKELEADAKHREISDGVNHQKNLLDKSVNALRSEVKP